MLNVQKLSKGHVRQKRLVCYQPLAALPLQGTSVCLHIQLLSWR